MRRRRFKEVQFYSLHVCKTVCSVSESLKSKRNENHTKESGVISGVSASMSQTLLSAIGEKTGTNVSVRARFSLAEP